MSADRFAEIERLYHEATLRPPEERAAFLERACSGDDALRREVESLLSVPTDAGEFLSRTALEEAARAGHRPWEPDSWPTIPGYTVRRVLGEGGMGVVYLAEQEKPFRRLVALKLIKPGMDTRQVVARFETERQALALMDHPNIAAVFDAGSTGEGRPYFVMEYVDGVAITDYCDRGRLSTRDRLALFVQVCAAVQHAHQKGVIHRDLKPSNVLIAKRDGHALPKVIDFGTAKAIGGAWNATATQGGQGMVLGTLEYMSPEQAALSADIDTATDVYSLGVLLYELLVGRLPFDTDELRAAGYDEMRRVIRESDPPKPSVRVEQRRDKSGDSARARQTDAPGLTRQLRGDLDWITLKALEKDRTRRYATVAAFATDIGRFLDDQPVEARPPSSAYRIRKFTRRHRGAVAAAAIILAILTAGVAVTGSLYWQVREALQESTYLVYTATLAAAAGDLRTGAAPEARARLLTVSETQRGWEWQHLFIQTDETVFSFASAVPDCPSLTSSTALTLDPDGESVVLRRCSTLERWGMPSLTHTVWAAPAKAFKLLAVGSRGQMLTTELTDRRHWSLVVTDRNGSAATVDLGPSGSVPICADISPDGARIAVGRGSDVFELWNTATGRLEFRLPASRDLNGLEIRLPPQLACVIQFSPDGRHVATSGARVHIWDAATGAERVTDSLQAGAYGEAIAFSQKGDRLAIGRPNGLVEVLDLSQLSVTLRRMSANGLVLRRNVFAVAFSPDGQTLVSGNSTTVGVWDIGQAKLVRVLSGHAADVVSLAVSADRIYSVDTAGVVRAWTVSDSPAVVRTPGSFTGSTPFRASADGSVIATRTSDGALATVRPLDLHREVIRSAAQPNRNAVVAISPDGRRLFTDESGSIRRWTIGSEEAVSVSKNPDINCRGTTYPHSLTISSDGRLLAFIDRTCVAVWDASTMKQLAVFVDTETVPMQVLFRDDETLIISSLDRNLKSPSLVRTWNSRTNRVLATLVPRPAVGPPKGMWRLALSPDRRRIALISSQIGTPKTVSIWDGDLKTEVGRLPPGDYLALAFSPDGRRIVTVGAEESVVRVWDAERLLPLLTLVDADRHWGGVVFTAAGQVVAGRTGGGLTIWDSQIRRR